MQPDELRLTIEQPAAQYGVVFETGLVEEIIKDIHGQAGYLPLLQYTLNLLWETEVQTGSINDRTLNISTYRELGGVRGALKKHVDQIYGALLESEKLATQRIFLKLVGIGEDSESGTEWKPIRRRANRFEFGDELEQSMLVKLINENLLVSDRQLQALESTVEIAHEILLTSWETLNTWIKENRNSIALRNRLNDDVVRWQGKKTEDELWTGSKLEQVLELRKDPAFNQVLGGLGQRANQFIDISVGLRDRRHRRTIIGLTSFSAIALSLAVIAGWQWQNSVISEVNALNTSSQALFSSDQVFDALLETLKASGRLKTVAWTKIGVDDLQNKVRASLAQALYKINGRVSLKNLWKGHSNSIRSVSFSPNSQIIASGSDDNTVKLWNLKGKQLQTLKGHKTSVISVTFSPNGEIIATASADKTVKLWNLQGQEIRTLKGHHESVNSVSFSPNGQIIATASADSTVKLWNLIKGKELNTLKGHTSYVNSVSFSPNGQIIATASADNKVKLWDLQGRELQTLHNSTAVNSVSFSPDGKLIVTGSAVSTLQLWTLQGQNPKTLKGHKRVVNSVSFSPDGKLIATASGDNTTKLWDLQGQEIRTLQGHESAVNSVSFSPDGKLIATASNDGTVKLWNLQGQEIRTLQGHKSAVNSVSFSPDGKLIATASADGTVKLWNLQGQALKTIQQNSPVNSVSFSPDGKIIAAASDDKIVKLWNLQGNELKTLAHSSSVLSVMFSPDGQKIAAASSDNIVKLWDLQGNELSTLQGHTDSVLGVTFSPDGKVIATASADTTVKLWNLQGKELATFKGHNKWVKSINFSPDGKMIASTSGDKMVVLWNVDFNYLLGYSCNLLHDYLVLHPKVLKELNQCQVEMIK